MVNAEVGTQIVARMKNELETAIAEMESVLTDPGFSNSAPDCAVAELENIVYDHRQMLKTCDEVLPMIEAASYLEFLSDDSEERTNVRFSETNLKAMRDVAKRLRAKVKIWLPHSYMTDEELTSIGVNPGGRLR